MDSAKQPATDTSSDTTPGNRDVHLARIGVALTAANSGQFVALYASSNILLPAIIALTLGESDKEFWLGAITATAGAIAIILSPIIGTFSDRTVSRLGPRAPWILAGAAIAAIGLALTGLVSGGIPLLLTWGFAQVGFISMGVAVSTVLPERVPLRRRGILSGVTGFATVIATILSGFLGASFVTQPLTGLIILAGIIVAGAVLFVIIAPHPAAAEVVRSEAAKDRPSLREFFRAFRSRNFTLVWIGRFSIVLAYQIILTRQLFFIQDRFGMNVQDAANTAAAVVGTAGLLQVVGLVASGPLSDKFGRRPFVYFGGTIVAVGLVLISFVDTVPAFVGAYAVLSLAFGTFIGVDTALAADVLPDRKGYGKDLGIINLAQSLPQVLAPAIGTVVLTFLGGTYAVLLIVAAVFALVGVGVTIILRGVR